MNKREKARRIKQCEKFEADLAELIESALTEYVDSIKNGTRFEKYYVCYIEEDIYVTFPPNYDSFDVGRSDPYAENVDEEIEALAYEDLEIYFSEVAEAYIEGKIDDIYLNIKDNF